MSQLRYTNFLLNCNRYGSQSQVLLELIEKTKSTGKKFTVHSIADCSGSSCTTIRSFLFDHPDKREGFHFHSLNGGHTVESVKNIVPQAEIEINPVRTPRNNQPNISNKKEEKGNKRKENSVKKPKQVKKTRKARDSSSESSSSRSRSRSRSKSGPLESRRKMKEKQLREKKDESRESKMFSLMENNYKKLYEEMENQKTEMREIKKTLVSSYQREQVMNQKQKTCEENIKILDRRTSKTDAKVEKLEESVNKMFEVTKVNQEILKTNQCQIRELINFQKTPTSKLTRPCNQGNQSQASSRPQQNTADLNKNSAFTAHFMNMPNKNRVNPSLAPTCKGSGFDRLLGSLLPSNL